MFCPQCRTEYREGFYTCRDCGVSLISELPLRNALSLKRGGESPYCFDPTRLMVRTDQADEAREILDGLKMSEPLTSGGSRSNDA